MARVEFLPAASLEVIEARAWYAGRAQGLGAAFTSEVDRQVARIGEAPLQFPLVLAGVRRALLRRFPYGLYFTVDDGIASVIACFHASRDPQQWEERLKG